MVQNGPSNLERVKLRCPLLNPSIEAVAIGEDGILEGAGNSTVWVDLSTGSPQLIRELHKIFSSKGALVLDVPVSGGVQGQQRDI